MPTLFRILITAILSILGCWTFYYNWPQRSVRNDSYTYSDEEAQHLRFYPNAQYAHGMHAWFQQQPETAASFFRQAVSQNALFLDAWLRLAETEAAMGREEKAKDILTFTTDMTDQVLRWKWPQMVLASELSMEKCFYRNTNYLLSHKVLEQDALQLLHTHLGGEASAVITVLEPAHLTAYLNWLMQWGMTDESLVVWQAMAAVAEPEKETAVRYAHFLLNHKRITASMGIWQKYTGVDGMTNPGFEKDITGRAFDWRHWGEKDGNWKLKRVDHDTIEGDYALRITFNGQENISFQHIYQIIVADPQQKYRLMYAWKSRSITTDQGPFVEIYGYDGKGLYQAGPMITGTHGWHKASIEFDMPEDCRSAVVRLRRRPSKRFDSKIRGKVWIDDFRLEKIETISTNEVIIWRQIKQNT
ncbi:MAG: tetratricopeptide repeat protein [Desulfosarcina sp.]|nr:tetratricopeptide repeat protein [Desulfosarcina sp.]MBC2743259.1 tetratricopeptide repeat protein [Desulfosarcina sp.]MBC2766169.1 tetratricopeptide repeat protein [Desulfosarcina sp.]